MPKVSSRSRYFAFPHDDLLFDARLEAIREEPAGDTAPAAAAVAANDGAAVSDIVIDFSTFEATTLPEPFSQDGRPHERVTGAYRPLRLRFLRAAWIAHTGAYECLDPLPDDEHVRRLFGVVHGRDPQLGDYYWVSTGAALGVCILRARGCRLEEREGERLPLTVARRWAPPPPHPTGLIPHRPALYRRFAGDPIAIQLNGRLRRHQFFIGGLHQQRAERPGVDHVLNLCGVENAWVANVGHHPDDRFLHKGEMSVGMSAEELLLEAGWVVERLRAGRRVLVHCYAGINRSSSVCCAALMLLEGLSAEEALARVRERHPSAWPDPYHWFVLRWLSAHGGAAPGGASGSPAAPAAPARRRRAPSIAVSALRG
jgi:hypothetical protein